MSEAPALVPIFPYAAEGGARTSSYFWQENWKSETKCLKIFDGKIAPQAKFMKQIVQARFFWLSPDVYKIFLTESWTNCISLREQWNKVRALRNHSVEGVGCKQPTEWKWTVITFTVWAVDLLPKKERKKRGDIVTNPSRHCYSAPLYTFWPA